MKELDGQKWKEIYNEDNFIFYKKIKAFYFLAKGQGEDCIKNELEFQEYLTNRDEHCLQMA